MTRFTALWSLLVAASFSGCAYPNQFRNARTDSPHAILIGHGVTVTHINDQPTAFWHCREKFRLPPSPTTVRTVAGHWKVHDYRALQFTAEANHSYSLRREQTGATDHVVLSDGQGRIIAKAARQ